MLSCLLSWTYLDENKKGFEMGSCIKQKASVLGEPLDVSFISSVDKDGSFSGGTSPVSVIDEISLLKGLVTRWIEIEVIQYLSIELCSV